MGPHNATPIHKDITVAIYILLVVLLPSATTTPCPPMYRNIITDYPAVAQGLPTLPRPADLYGVYYFGNNSGKNSGNFYQSLALFFDGVHTHRASIICQDNLSLFIQDVLSYILIGFIIINCTEPIYSSFFLYIYIACSNVKQTFTIC